MSGQKEIESQRDGISLPPGEDEEMPCLQHSFYGGSTNPKLHYFAFGVNKTLVALRLPEHQRFVKKGELPTPKKLGLAQVTGLEARHSMFGYYPFMGPFQGSHPQPFKAKESNLTAALFAERQDNEPLLEMIEYHCLIVYIQSLVRVLLGFYVISMVVVCPLTDFSKPGLLLQI